MRAAVNSGDLAPGSQDTRHGPRRRLAAPARNTLQRLERWRAGAVAGVALLVLLLAGAVDAVRGTERTVAAERLPAVEAAGRLRGSLEALDLCATEDLLHNEAAGGRVSGTASLSERRAELLHELIETAEHNPPGEEQRRSFAALEAGLGDYEGQLQRARDLKERAPAEAIPAFERADQVMTGQLVPAAETLQQGATEAMEAAIRTERLPFRMMAGLAGLSAVALLWWLLRAQGNLSRETNRRLNAPLLAATMLILGAGVGVTGTLNRAENGLQGTGSAELARTERALRIRSGLLTALRETSRATLLPREGAPWRAAAQRETEAVVTMPSDLSPAELLEAVRTGHTAAGFQGLLAEATAADQPAATREAALRVLQAWVQPSLVPAAPRSPGHPPPTDETLNRAAEMDAYLQALVTGSEGELAEQLQSSATLAADAGWAALVCGILAAGLTVLGFAPRLREYRGH